MAATGTKRRKGKAGTSAHAVYFRSILGANRAWITATDPTPILARFQQDHPGAAVTDQVRQALTAAQTKLQRSNGAARTGDTGTGRRHAHTLAPAAGPMPMNSTQVGLLNLRLQIHSCLASAQNLGATEAEELLMQASRSIPAPVGANGGA